MADKRIQDLAEATSVDLTDLFVLEQSGTAKKLTGDTLVSQLAAALDGHGGISSISYTPPASGSLDGTLTITLADGTPYSATVKNGKAISVVTDYYAVSSSNSTAPATWYSAPQTMTPEDRYLWHYQRLTFNDGSTLDTTAAVVGVYGDTGQQTYVWFKWAGQNPSSDADISDLPGPWIGVYAGTAASPPSQYTAYRWYNYKGSTGDAGKSIVSVTLDSSSGVVDTYAVNFSDGTSTTFSVTNGSNIESIAKTSTNGLTDIYTVTLTDGSTTNFSVVNGKSIISVEQISGTHAAGTTDTYRITFNDGDTVDFTVYNGLNGTGSVSTVSGIQADGTGDVPQLVLRNGAPTPSTVGQINQLYYDLSGGMLYVCTMVYDGSYTWAGTAISVDDALSSMSVNPVQNAVLTGIIGLAALNTTAQTLTEAINEVLLSIPEAAAAAPGADTPSGAAGTGAAYARSDHRHPLNVATSGTPADLGAAAHGTAQTYARSDHVHKMPTAANVGAVAKTGDEMSGDLLINGEIRLDNNSITDGTPPSSTVWAERLMFRDSADNIIAQVNPVFATDGKQSVQMMARRLVGNALTDTILRIGSDASGNRFVQFEGAGLDTAFRSALGLGTNGAFPLTIGQGGTGQTETSTDGTASNVAIASSGTTISAARATWWGKVVMIRVVCTRSSASTSDVLLFTMKSPFIPPYEAALIAQRTTTPLTCYLGGNGEVHVSGSVQANTNIIIEGTYIMKN